MYTEAAGETFAKQFEEQQFKRRAFVTERKKKKRIEYVLHIRAAQVSQLCSA